VGTSKIYDVVFAGWFSQEIALGYNAKEYGVNVMKFDKDALRQLGEGVLRT